MTPDTLKIYTRNTGAEPWKFYGEMTEDAWREEQGEPRFQGMFANGCLYVRTEKPAGVPIEEKKYKEDQYGSMTLVDVRSQGDQKLIELMTLVDEVMFKNLGDKVKSGPFEGMTIPHKSIKEDGNTSCKLLGCYEIELHGSIEKVIERKPRTIVNVGCAEGYYAIGLAGQLPEATVYAIDENMQALNVCNEYAQRNGIDRVKHVCGRVECGNQIVFEGDAPYLYVVDIEGAEQFVLDTEFCPNLAHSDMIVECHDFIVPDTAKILRERFEATHDIDVIPEQLPDLTQFPWMKPCSNIFRAMVITEKRPTNTSWLALWAKDRV